VGRRRGRGKEGGEAEPAEAAAAAEEEK